ncbi:hypothetical protein ADIS_1136 [Lunatimonas lonarensis]|uniref:Uncharacterized protein n=1 Tax=Lunatimonas lonarensis TaxID=1232681 RepID=R7ZW80_9BACT|nr:hypothetical protein ADIS_1136 [Lunatimonas lonarensis]
MKSEWPENCFFYNGVDLATNLQLRVSMAKKRFQFSRRRLMQLASDR